ncbi:MAG: hypothetical protein HYS98_05710 [Deltaproteobacteria bacterium]|nr:hypothetical protein [Deltaproteobacteria bacterium]
MFALLSQLLKPKVIFAAALVLVVAAWVPLRAERVQIEGYVDVLSEGLVLFMVDGIKKGESPLVHGRFFHEIDVIDRDKVLHLIVLDSGQNPSLQRIIALDTVTVEQNVTVGFASSIAASLSRYKVAKARKFLENRSARFERLTQSIAAVCLALKSLGLEESLSHLELMDRLAGGETLLAILKSKLGKEIAGQVLIHLERNPLFKNSKGKFDLEVLHDLIRIFR